MGKVFQNVGELETLDMNALTPREAPKGILMCSPEAFQVFEIHNYFQQGNISKVEQDTATRDWKALHDALAQMTNVEVIPSEPDCPDMIFVANAALTTRFPGGSKKALMSRMVYPSRRAETPPFEAYLRERGYEILTLPEGLFYEGQGDSLWHPGLGLLWGGWGRRSIAEAYTHIAKLLDVPVILLELVSELYHLDTCFCPIDEETVLYCPAAFKPEGRALIEHMFPHAIAVSKDVGMTFACNAVVLGKQIIMPEGGESARVALENAGFEPVFIPMSQMMKSGGAVRCCTLDDY